MTMKKIPMLNHLSLFSNIVLKALLIRYIYSSHSQWEDMRLKASSLHRRQSGSSLAPIFLIPNIMVHRHQIVSSKIPPFDELLAFAKYNNTTINPFLTLTFYRE